MARAIKDQSGEEIPPVDNPTPINSVQLKITEKLEEQLIQIVLEDFNSSKEARSKRDYGQDSKGGNLDFDKWLKSLRDLYNSRREAKEIPWKYCSNRSLRISASILDMIHSRLFPAVVNEDLLRWRPGEVT